MADLLNITSRHINIALDSIVNNMPGFMEAPSHTSMADDLNAMFNGDLVHQIRKNPVDFPKDMKEDQEKLLAAKENEKKDEKAQ